MTRAWLSLVALTAGLAVGTAAAVPAAEKEAKKRLGRFHVGPVFLTPKLQLKNAGVDTNVFNQRTGEIADTSVILSPTMLAALPVGRRLRLTGEGHVDFNYFRRESGERSTDFGGKGRVELDVGPLTLFGGGGADQSRQRFSIDFDQRILRHERWAIVGVTIAPTKRLSASVSGTGRIYEFGSFVVRGFNVKENLDRNELTGSVLLRFALTRQTALIASADSVEDRFLRQARSASRLTRSHRFLAGFEFGEKALIRGKVLAGVRDFPASSSAPRYRGPALSVSSSVPLLHYGLLTILAERDVYYAMSPVMVASDRFRNTYVSTRFSGEAAVNLPFSSFGRGSVGVVEAKYLLPYPQGSSFAPRVDHFWTMSASLLRAFRIGVRVGGTIQWVRRVSSFPSFSYEGLRYGVQAEVVP